MDLAKPGKIKEHCDPNALSTFQEYLIDYASPQTRSIGEKLINDTLNIMAPKVKHTSEQLLKQVRAGKRDVFC